MDKPNETRIMIGKVVSIGKIYTWDTAPIVRYFYIDVNGHPMSEDFPTRGAFNHWLTDQILSTKVPQ
jgi:hypothetical protein